MESVIMVAAYARKAGVGQTAQKKSAIAIITENALKDVAFAMKGFSGMIVQSQINVQTIAVETVFAKKDNVNALKGLRI